MKRKLKIVYMLGQGYSSWAVHIARSFLANGHEVTIVCPEDGPIAGLRQEQVLVQAIHFPHKMKDLPGIVTGISELACFLKASRPDVIHYFLPPSTLWGRVAGWLTRVPVRACQLSGPWHLEIPVVRFLELSTAWMDTTIIASSKALQRDYGKYSHIRKKVSLSYFGIPLEPFDPTIEGDPVRRELGLTADGPVIGLVAYMYPPIKSFHPVLGIKGHEIFLEAAREIADKNSQASFLIVGDEPLVNGEPMCRGTYRARLEQMAFDLGLAGRVVFAGYRADVARVLAAIDVVAVPSLSENVGGAVEPLLMEKPVVASNVGGLPDVVIEGETGFLVPPGDPHRLAERILWLLAVPLEERQRMGRQGRAIVADLFDLHKTAGQLEALYYEQLERVGRACA